MSKVTDCARALGEAIVASEEYKNMQITESAAMSDPAVADAMARYMEVKNTLGEVMCQADADADLIAQYGQELDAIPNFSEMMNQVNSVLEYIITGELPQQGGCSGNCSGCSGCH